MIDALLNRIRRYASAVVLYAGFSSGCVQGSAVADDYVEIMSGGQEIKIGGATFALNALERGEFADPIAGLNSDLEVHGFKLRVSSCAMMLRIAVPTANGNRSYGGLCSVNDQGARIEVQVCNDEMRGSLTFAPTWHEKTFEEELAYFTAINCVGG